MLAINEGRVHLASYFPWINRRVGFSDNLYILLAIKRGREYLLVSSVEEHVLRNRTNINYTFS
jgi:hypothetical protein